MILGMLVRLQPVQCGRVQQYDQVTIDQETTLSDSTVRLSLDQILAIVGKQTIELEMAKAQIAALQEQVAKLEEASKPVDPKKAE